MIKTNPAARPSTRSHLVGLMATALFAALIVLCSWIAIPLTVSVTLQTFAIFAAVGLLGTRRSLAAIGLYILLGLIGLPVFTGFGAGLGVLMGATGGFIIGFLPCCLVSGLLMERFGRGITAMAAAMAAGLLVCYACGTAWFTLVYLHGASGSLTTALTVCVLPFVLPDAAKIALAIVITRRLEPVVGRMKTGVKAD